MSEIGLWRKTFYTVFMTLALLTSGIALFFGDRQFVPGLVLWLVVMTSLAAVLALAGSPFSLRMQRESLVCRIREPMETTLKPETSVIIPEASIEPDPRDLGISGQVNKLERWIRS